MVEKNLSPSICQTLIYDWQISRKKSYLLFDQIASFESTYYASTILYLKNKTELLRNIALVL